MDSSRRSDAVWGGLSVHALQVSCSTETVPVSGFHTLRLFSVSTCRTFPGKEREVSSQCGGGGPVSLHGGGLLLVLLRRPFPLPPPSARGLPVFNHCFPTRRRPLRSKSPSAGLGGGRPGGAPPTDGAPKEKASKRCYASQRLYKVLSKPVFKHYWVSCTENGGTNHHKPLSQLKQNNIYSVLTTIWRALRNVMHIHSQ